MTLKIGNAMLFQADCRAILPTLHGIDILLTDQPYGINYEVNARTWIAEGLTAMGQMSTGKKGAIIGDSEPFDPTPFLRFPKVAFFGANHCARLLPEGGKWIIWDKRRDSKPDDHSDCEIIWTNVAGADRIHRQKWRGVVREGEENCTNSKKLHPNQKPVALLQFILRQMGAEPGQTVFDPFMGSGSTAIAALRLKMNFVGIELDQKHFDVARARIEAEVAALQLALI